VFDIAISFHKQGLNVSLVIADSVVFSEHDSRAEVSQHMLVFYKPNNVRIAHFFNNFFLIDRLTLKYTKPQKNLNTKSY